MCEDRQAAVTEAYAGGSSGTYTSFHDAFILFRPETAVSLLVTVNPEQDMARETNQHAYRRMSSAGVPTVNYSSNGGSKR
jgi:hypothetical protein